MTGREDLAGFDPKRFTAPLQYLRKADNFKRRGAKRVLPAGYRPDGTVVYRKGAEFLILRSVSSGAEKIVTYGINED